MIIMTNSQHASAINDLALKGKIKPVTFWVDGEQIKANSVWAATSWLKLKDKYKNGATIKFDL